MRAAVETSTIVVCTTFSLSLSLVVLITKVLLLVSVYVSIWSEICTTRYRATNIRKYGTIRMASVTLLGETEKE
jgi:nitrate/nitrite-specific signal transduction histidine kinase